MSLLVERLNNYELIRFIKNSIQPFTVGFIKIFEANEINGKEYLNLSDTNIKVLFHTHNFELQNKALRNELATYNITSLDDSFGPLLDLYPDWFDENGKNYFGLFVSKLNLIFFYN